LIGPDSFHRSNVTLRYVAATNLEKRKIADALNSVVDQNAQGKARGENPDFREKEKGTGAAVPLRFWLFSGEGGKR
jgi:hypothetical protein